MRGIAVPHPGEASPGRVLDIDGKGVKQGLLGLVIALVEIIRDALKLQAVRRMEGGRLTEVEVERLGEALLALDGAIEEIKREQGIEEAVRAVREGLDGMVDQVLTGLIGREDGER